MENNLVNKICNFAYVSAIIGVCTLGICPAFAAVALALSIVIKNRKIELDDKFSKKIKTAVILSIISLFLFVVDIVIAVIFFG